ncbi:MAG: BrnT family toxin [Magnetococcales bacterium]|nr:BrnT family toxin [Magnetococcales bacterium]
MPCWGKINYGEERMIGYAPIDRRLYCVVFVDRGEVRRVISLRKANSREVRVYETAIGNSDA